METIGDRVKALRIGRGESRDQLAVAVGAPRKTSIQNVEDAPKGRSSKYLRKIAAHYRVRLAWLETGEGPREAEPFTVAASTYQSARPNPSIMAMAYGAVLALADRAGVRLNVARADHMEILCDAYAMIAEGKRVFPSEPDAPELADIIQQRLGIRGLENGRSERTSAG